MLCALIHKRCSSWGEGPFSRRLGGTLGYASEAGVSMCSYLWRDLHSGTPQGQGHSWVKQHISRRREAHPRVLFLPQPLTQGSPSGRLSQSSICLSSHLLHPCHSSQPDNQGPISQILPPPYFYTGCSLAWNPLHKPQPLMINSCLLHIF